MYCGICYIYIEVVCALKHFSSISAKQVSHAFISAFRAREARSLKGKYQVCEINILIKYDFNYEIRLSWSFSIHDTILYLKDSTDDISRHWEICRATPTPKDTKPSLSLCCNWQPGINWRSTAARGTGVQQPKISWVRWVLCLWHCHPTIYR